MLPQEIIRKKRDGGKLPPDMIDAFVKGVASGAVSEGQIGAFCMAVVLNGMDVEERAALTRAMAHSGRTMTWDLPGPVLDKHSTGGIGDKVSLILAPVIAACGGFVPMISGRGLGHTGGTLDKMDSIPGYVSQPDAALFEKVVREKGCAIIGATPDLAPADRAMYAVRDVTATVESSALITASILSKKLAAGLSALVMDVKTGSGAFMQKEEEARALAQSIASVATAAGLPTVCLLTDMNQILGRFAGNALEVREAVAFLRNDNPDPRLYEVTAALCAEMLVQGKLAAKVEEARGKVHAALAGGFAAEKFAAMVGAMGGPSDFMDRLDKYLPSAPCIRDIDLGGKIAAMDVRKIGLGIVEMGGGRSKPSDAIDHRVGLSSCGGIGETARFTIHAADADDFARMEQVLKDAVTLGDGGVPGPIVRGRITA